MPVVAAIISVCHPMDLVIVVVVVVVDVVNILIQPAPVSMSCDIHISVDIHDLTSISVHICKFT